MITKAYKESTPMTHIERLQCDEDFEEQIKKLIVRHITEAAQAGKTVTIEAPGDALLKLCPDQGLLKDLIGDLYCDGRIEIETGKIIPQA